MNQAWVVHDEPTHHHPPSHFSNGQGLGGWVSIDGSHLAVYDGKSYEKVDDLGIPPITHRIHVWYIC